MTAATAPSEGARERVASLDRTAVVGGIGVAVAIATVGARNGGYFPTAWGWSALVFGWCAVIVLVVGRELVVDKYTAVLVGAFVLFNGWIWLSTIWSVSRAVTVLEGERGSAYAAFVLTLALVGRRIGAAAVMGGIVAGGTIISVYALATRLFPQRIGTYDPVATYRLAAPVGYWNALGLFAAVSALLALALVARSRSLLVRSAAAAAVVFLAATAYFTFSRGSWLALAIGLVVLVALDPRRLQALAVVLAAAASPAAAVVYASRQSALTTQGAPLSMATQQGHRVAVALLAAAGVAALLGAAIAWVERAYAPSLVARRAFAGVLVLAVVAALAVATVHWGSPAELARRGWHGFTAAPRTAASGSNLNHRLFDLSNDGRINGWKSVLREWRHRPVVGTGAGTFEDWWLAHRPRAQQIRDAHSLYLETLGELGIVGLALLLLVVVTPLVAAWRHRRDPLVPFAAGAFAAWAVHAGVDWDWEVPAVTLIALACAVVCVSGSGGRTWRLNAPARIGIGTVAAAIALFGIVAGVGNQALASSQKALDSANYGKADSEARRAARWAPWLADPWIIRGQIQGLNQDRAAARRDFRKAIAKDPRNYLAWYGLAGVETGPARRKAAAQVVALNPLSDEAAEMRKILSAHP